MSAVKLNITGMNAVTKYLNPQEAQKGMTAAMNTVVEDASTLLAEATPVGIYGFMQSAWTQTKGVEVTGTGQLVGFSDPSATASYAWYVIHGTKPARGNPWRYILPWVEKKLAPYTQLKILVMAGMKRTALVKLSTKLGSVAASVAFIIGRKRMKQGSKGNDFVTPIAEQNKALWGDVLKHGAFQGE